MKLQRRLMIIAVGACCILATIQSIPIMIWSFYMINATHQLLRVYPNSTEQVYIPSLENTTALDKIPVLLENARQWRLENPLAYRWLIKTNITRQDWQAALNVADLAVGQLRLDNRLLKNEIAVPYLYKIGQQQICNGAIKLSFTNLGSWIEDKTSFNDFADTLLYQGQPVLARGAYCIANQLYGTKNSPDITFRDTVLSIMARQSDAQARLQATKINGAAPEKYVLNSSLTTIPGTSLYWMTPIPYYNVSFGNLLNMWNTEIGIFPWNGEAITIIDVPRSGEFKINVHVRDSEPAPTRMALGINGRREHYFELTVGNNTWQTISATTRLDRGLYSISIWFLNNDTVDGRDRDGAVQWVEIQSTATYHAGQSNDSQIIQQPSY